MRESSIARVAVWGVGAMGRLTAALCLDRGIEVVGAIARNAETVGQDIGTLVGAGPTGVVVRSDAAAMLAATRPDIVVLTTTSGLEVIEPQLRTCVTNGANVVTLEEETLFPWTGRASTIATALDDLARAHGVTILATGLQDACWHAMASRLMASALRIDVVRGRSTWNSDDYGTSVQDYLLIGEDPAVVTDGDTVAGWEAVTVRTALEALAQTHDLTVIDKVEQLRPVVADRTVVSPRSGLVVPAGRLLGLSEHVSLRTREGITLELEMTGYLHGAGEVSVNEWTVEGHPRTTVIMSPFDGRTATCTAVVNRIPDVLAAPAGLASLDRLPPARFRTTWSGSTA